MSKKEIKITFHTLSLSSPSKDNNEFEEHPFFSVGDLIDYIRVLGDDDKTRKFFDLKDNKFCFIDYSNKLSIKNDTIYVGFFKSARHEFRPNLINKLTGVERDNPKELNEGDVEKTHFLIKITSSDVFLLLERNRGGISSQNFLNYIKEFKRKQLRDDGLEDKFRLEISDIASSDFMTEIKRMSRTSCAEVFIDKQLLGDEALNFSNRIVPIKKEVMLTLKAKPKECIKNVAVDMWNIFNCSKSKISRIRVRGRDDNDNSILLDTSFLCKAKSVHVDINSETGEINTAQLLSELKIMANDFE